MITHGLKAVMDVNKKG